MAADKLILECVYDHEKARGDVVFLTQPTGGGQVKDYTWAQMMDEVRRMAAHLKAQNFEPGARIALLAKNSAHFIMSELAIWMAGGTTVAIFPTEGAETIKYVLEHSGASLLFVGKLDSWAVQKAGVPAGLPCIALPLAPKTDYETWDAVVARTKPLSGRVARAGGDICMLTYTSGSTGQPKGVMHSFERISAATRGAIGNMRGHVGSIDARMLSYLPLAHVYERQCVEAVALMDGKVHIFFAETLDTFLKDLNRARPNMFLSVPRLWLKFQQGVFAKMPPQKLDKLLKIPVVRGIIGKKVLKGLGLNEVLLAGSGSAPIPADLIAWYRKLGLNLIEGYGMTEDFAYSHSCTATVQEAGCVGMPMPGVQVRISEEGEILIKSPGQMVGYYKRPDLNAEVFTADGYFRTGDRGERRADGMLKITGRVKELFKTSKGEYIAPAPIENKINANSMIEACMVSGLGQPAPYALVVLNEQIRPTQHEPAKRAVLEQELTTLLAHVNKELLGHERMQLFVVAKEPWSIENGLLTPTMKIKRNKIEAVVNDKVEAWFDGGKKVIWA